MTDATKQDISRAVSDVESAINTALLIVADANGALRRALLDSRRRIRLAIGEGPT